MGLEAGCGVGYSMVAGGSVVGGGCVSGWWFSLFESSGGGREAMVGVGVQSAVCVTVCALGVW